MTDLIKVANWTGTPSGHVIFVHGLGGHAYDTWRREKTEESFWPLWLASDLVGVTVWTVDYAAPPTNWLGNALPLQDRAVSVVERLLSEPELADGPIAFVCHSLGGLVIKQVLREAQSQHSHRPDAGALLNRVKAVVFFATPHTGSSKANLLDRLRLVTWPSTAAADLMRNDPNLRNLNIWYRNWSTEISHKLFYETQSTSVGTIVDASSADAGLPGVVPVPLEADHLGVCKPTGTSDLGYVGTRDFLFQQLGEDTTNEHDNKVLVKNTLPAVVRSRPSTWVPVLIRLTLLIVLGSMVYHYVTKASIKQTINGDNGTQIIENSGVIKIVNESEPDTDTSQ